MPELNSWRSSSVATVDLPAADNPVNQITPPRCPMRLTRSSGETLLVVQKTSLRRGPIPRIVVDDIELMQWSLLRQATLRVSEWMPSIHHQDQNSTIQYRTRRRVRRSSTRRLPQ